MADAVCEILTAGFRNEKHKSQWKNTLATYAAPFRHVPVDLVDTDGILLVLNPIWMTKEETASMAVDAVLRRMHVDFTVHGFRSSFRDWAGNKTEFPRELIETALAHVIGDKAEQAYRRGDAFERRRKVMDEWWIYCHPIHQ